jgi:hypothetical protein
MKSLNQWVLASGAVLGLLSVSGCMSTGPTTAQSKNDTWCSNHPK